jgi:hypothetical protein
VLVFVKKIACTKELVNAIHRGIVCVFKKTPLFSIQSAANKGRVGEIWTNGLLLDLIDYICKLEFWLLDSRLTTIHISIIIPFNNQLV